MNLGPTQNKTENRTIIFVILILTLKPCYVIVLNKFAN